MRPQLEVPQHRAAVRIRNRVESVPIRQVQLG